MNHTPAESDVPQRWNIGLLLALVLLTSAVVTIVVIGFLGSYGPLRDAFLAIHQSPPAAARDPWAVDGLVTVAIAAAIWLRHETAARRYAITVAAVTTSASLLLNYLHGCGVIRPGGGTAGPLHPALVLIIASLPVSAIGFGSHLFIACLRNLSKLVPRTGTELQAQQDEPCIQDDGSPTSAEPDQRTGTDQVVGGTQLDPSLLEQGRQALAGLAKDGIPPTRDALRARMGVGNSKASAVWTHLRSTGETPLDRSYSTASLFELADRFPR